MTKKTIRKFLSEYFLKYIWLEILAIIAMVLESILILVAPYLSKILIDDVLINKDLEKFHIVIACLILAMLLQMVFSYFKDILFFKVGENVLRDIRLTLVNHVLNVTTGKLEKMTVGEVLSRVENDVKSLGQIASSLFIQLIANIVNIVLILCVMLYLEWRLTLFSISIMAAYIISYKILNHKVEEKSRLVLEADTNWMSFLSDMISNVRTIKYNNAQKWIVEIGKNNYEKVFNRNIDLNEMQSLNMHIVMAWVILAWGGMWAIGGYSIIEGTATLGTLMAIMNYQNRLFSPLRLFAYIGNQLKVASVSLDRIYEILNMPIEKNTDKEVDNKIKGKIEFKDVFYGYDHDTPILKGVNFTIKEGETVAIIGQSGSGKTTILNLLMGGYEVQKGKILLDGIDITDFSKYHLRNQISMIPEKIDLFKMSIHENLTMGKKDINDESIKEMCSHVDIEQHILSLPNTYKAIIDERGRNLSLGQIKRLGIVRALLQKPKILILDEIMSSLDIERRKCIHSIISNFKGNITTILVSHQLEDLSLVDRVLILEQGNIREVRDINTLISDQEKFKAIG